MNSAFHGFHCSGPAQRRILAKPANGGKIPANYCAVTAIVSPFWLELEADGQNHRYRGTGTHAARNGDVHLEQPVDFLGRGARVGRRCRGDGADRNRKRRHWMRQRVQVVGDAKLTYIEDEDCA